MIVSFYDKNLISIAGNSSLMVAKDSYSLIKRPVEMNSLTCTCEAINGDVQPVFLVIMDDRGRGSEIIYGCLAGVPILDNKKQTQINGTDLKSVLSSDIYFEPYGSYEFVNHYLAHVFLTWKEQVNQDTLPVRLEMNAADKPFTNLIPANGKVVINAYDELANYLKAYDMYLDTRIDLVNKEIIFTIGDIMTDAVDVKLWEYGVNNYGKWVADINEAQGYYHNDSTDEWQAGIKWILTSDNKITATESNRDIFPVKKTIVTSTDSIEAANEDSLTALLDSLYNENIEIQADENLRERASFKSKFAVWMQRGAKGYKYKDLPCGELRYDEYGLTEIQIGYRYSGLDFI